MREKTPKSSNTPRIRQVSPYIWGKEIPLEQRVIGPVLSEAMSREMGPTLTSIVHDKALEISKRKGQPVKAQKISDLIQP